MSTTALHAILPSDLDRIRLALASEYDVFEELGRGGMATVYRACERQLGRDVAVKVLPFHLAFDESIVERFQREARISAQLEHPNIVPIYRVGRSGDVIYFVMKYLRGQSLAVRLRENGRLPVDEVQRILIESAGALAYAGRCNVVHRDIKPDNIVLDEDGRCSVTDFGIARSAADTRLTATGMSVGTPRYMSPEQARTRPLDGRSDVYSLGIVGYECLVGRTPFDGQDAFSILLAHISEPLPRPALVTSEERRIFAVIERMLEKDPDQRFQTADEVIVALESERTVSVRGVTHDRRVHAVSPTRPVPALSDASATVGQQPKLDAALAVGHVFVESQGARLQRLGASLLEYVAETHAYTARQGRRFWMSVLAGCVVSTGAFYGAHFATKHRSRCSAVVASNGASALGNNNVAGVSAAPAGEHKFSILLDAVGSPERGDDLDVYYDVCGLEAGVAYTAHIAVVKNESGLKRLLGRSVDPITVSYDETARGPATRRHRTLDFGDMPSGSYSIDLVVKDANGRSRARASTFRLIEH